VKTLTAVPLAYEMGLFCSDSLPCSESLVCSDYGRYPAMLDAGPLFSGPGTFPGTPTFPGATTFPGPGTDLSAAVEGDEVLEAVPVS